MPIIHKATEGYGYSYADLPAIFEVINPLLKKHGLGFTQPVNENVIKTILFHIESCETLESTTNLIDGVKLAKMNDFQVLGSQITYLRRYALSSLLGLVTDKDTDGAGDQSTNSDTKNDKPWLNPNTEAWKNAIGKKATINAVKQHYKISKDNETKYLN